MVTGRRSASRSVSPAYRSIVVVDARKLVVTGAVNPDRRRAGEVRPHGGQPIDELRGHDQMSGRGDVDAMRERRPGEIRVEQRDDAADAGDAEPDGHVLGAVRHQQADGVALGQPLLERPAGISGRSFRERAIGQALAVREQRRRVAERLGELLDDGRQNAIGMPGNRRRQLERARPRPGSDGWPDIGCSTVGAAGIDTPFTPCCPRRR